MTKALCAEEKAQQTTTQQRRRHSSDEGTPARRHSVASSRRAHSAAWPSPALLLHLAETLAAENTLVPSRIAMPAFNAVFDNDDLLQLVLRVAPTAALGVARGINRSFCSFVNTEAHARTVRLLEELELAVPSNTAVSAAQTICSYRTWTEYLDARVEERRPQALATLE